MSTSRILTTERVKVTDIQPHPENARKGNLEEIKISLEEHGQYRTIVVNRRNNYILAGNHTFLGAVDLGWEEVEVNWVEADEIAEKKILLVDNRSSDTSGYDNEKLAAMLEGMMLAGHLKGTGWDAESVDDLMSGLDALPQIQGEEFTGGYAETAEETAGRYRAPGDVVPQRQFIIMIPETEAVEFETGVNTLKKNWGIGDFRSVMREAVSACVKALPDPPVARCRACGVTLIEEVTDPS